MEDSFPSLSNQAITHAHLVCVLCCALTPRVCPNPAAKVSLRPPSISTQGPFAVVKETLITISFLLSRARLFLQFPSSLLPFCSDSPLLLLTLLFLRKQVKYYTSPTTLGKNAQVRRTLGLKPLPRPKLIASPRNGKLVASARARERCKHIPMVL